jgi:hypothetical protein
MAPAFLNTTRLRLADPPRMTGTFRWSSGLGSERTYHRIWVCENPIVDNGVDGIGYLYPEGKHVSRLLLSEPITVHDDEVLDIEYTHYYADGVSPQIRCEITQEESA